MHMPIGWNGMSMPTEGCSVHVLNRTLSHIWWRLYLPTFLLSVWLLTLMYIDSLIVLARPWSSLPIILEFSGLVLCPVWVLCAWMDEGSLRCSCIFLQRSWMSPLCTPHHMQLVLENFTYATMWSSHVNMCTASNTYNHDRKAETLGKPRVTTSICSFYPLFLITLANYTVDWCPFTNYWENLVDSSIVSSAV